MNIQMSSLLLEAATISLRELEFDTNTVPLTICHLMKTTRN